METQILVIATLDTKESEALFLKECIQSMGFRVVLMDTGILSTPNEGVDISQDEVAERGGMSLKDAIGTGDNAKCTGNMALGAAAITKELFDQERIQGIIGSGWCQYRLHLLACLY